MVNHHVPLGMKCWRSPMFTEVLLENAQLSPVCDGSQTTDPMVLIWSDPSPQSLNLRDKTMFRMPSCIQLLVHVCKCGGGVRKKIRIKKKISGSRKNFSGSKKKIGLKTIATSRREGREKERKGKERKGRGGRKEGRKGSKEGMKEGRKIYLYLSFSI